MAIMIIFDNHDDTIMMMILIVMLELKDVDDDNDNYDEYRDDTSVE